MTVMLARVTHVEKAGEERPMARGNKNGSARCRLRRLGRGFACGAALVGMLALQMPTPVAWAGPYDPGRVRSLGAAGMGPVLGRSLAAGVTLRLPFQATRRDASPFGEARVAFGLSLRAPAALGARPGLPVSGYQRPLLRLSFAFTGRADALRLNGLPLAGPEAFYAEGEEASADTHKKKHKSRKWWWIGGGAVLIGILAAAGTAIGDSEPSQFGPPPDQS